MIDNIRKQFPFFNKNKGWIYFDNAATSQKPKAMIEAIKNYYESATNLNRGDYQLAWKNNDILDQTRQKVATLIGSNASNIAFVSGTTSASNLVANSISFLIEEGDIILTTKFEHASNTLPWVEIAKEKKAIVKIVELDDNFEVDIAKLEKILSPKVKVFAMHHISNTISNVLNVEAICTLLNKHNVISVIDMAQSISQHKIDLKKINPSFAFFSAHKVYGPTGLGALYFSDQMFNVVRLRSLGGGQPFEIGPWEYKDETTLIESWNDSSKPIFNRTTNHELVNNKYMLFEAGTLPIASIVGFEKSLDLINEIGINQISKHAKMLKKYAVEKMLTIPNIEIVNKSTLGSIVLFNIKGVNAQDVASYLSVNKIAVRSGVNCARLLPLFTKDHIFVRVSFGIYNTTKEIDKFVKVMKLTTDYLGGVI